MNRDVEKLQRWMREHTAATLRRSKKRKSSPSPGSMLAARPRAPDTQPGYLAREPAGSILLACIDAMMTGLAVEPCLDTPNIVSANTRSPA